MLNVNLKKYNIHFLGALMLLLAALWNHFPLVTSDTGAYIENAYHLYLPNDRPITYSYFTIISSMHITLWLTILCQCLLLSFLLVSFIKHVIQHIIQEKYILLILILLILFTGCSWYSSQVMPDIFTPVIFLTSINYFYVTTFKEKLFYLALIYFSILTHNSNLVISFLFFSSLLLYYSVVYKNQIIRKKVFILLTVSILAWLSLCSLHFISGNGFKPSKSSHIFLIAKLAENGILKEYLNEHCKDNNFKLCVYKDNLPNHAWDFIWNADGAFAHSGYWDSSSVEYSKIIKGTLTEPKFLWMNIKESLKATMIQFIKTDVGDGLTPQVDGSNPYWKIQEHYSGELKQYLRSKQNMGSLNFTFLNQFYFFSFLLSIGIFLILTVMRKIKPYFIFLFSMGTIFCFLNAFTTASLANILARLNSRCIWILPMIVIIAIIDSFLVQNEKIKKVALDTSLET